jgi:hypothetical protein
MQLARNTEPLSRCPLSSAQLVEGAGSVRAERVRDGEVRFGTRGKSYETLA